MRGHVHFFVNLGFVALDLGWGIFCKYIDG